jgi:hypothetical protein
VQFETIHPFLDGNGRVGRLLIALQLAADGLLREPLLYLSLHFKAHRQTYYDLLNGVRLNGDWEAWLEFFAEAVLTSATEAGHAARRLQDLDGCRTWHWPTAGASATWGGQRLPLPPCTAHCSASPSPLRHRFAPPRA